MAQPFQGQQNLCELSLQLVYHHVSAWKRTNERQVRFWWGDYFDEFEETLDDVEEDISLFRTIQLNSASTHIYWGWQLQCTLSFYFRGTQSLRESSKVRCGQLASESCALRNARIENLRTVRNIWADRFGSFFGAPWTLGARCCRQCGSRADWPVICVVLVQHDDVVEHGTKFDVVALKPWLDIHELEVDLKLLLSLYCGWSFGQLSNFFVRSKLVNSCEITVFLSDWQRLAVLVDSAPAKLKRRVENCMDKNIFSDAVWFETQSSWQSAADTSTCLFKLKLGFIRILKSRDWINCEKITEKLLSPLLLLETFMSHLRNEILQKFRLFFGFGNDV